LPPAIESAHWLVIALLTIVLVIASYSDVRDRRIPNWTIVAIAVLFIPWTLVGGIPVFSSLEAGLVAFLISCPLYVVRVVGAGDSKLLTVTALFVGADRLIFFLVWVALVGGMIAVASLALRQARAMGFFATVAPLSVERGVPYGVAIAIAAVGVTALPGFNVNWL
jgi:prepilin peptidase CpaA